MTKVLVALLAAALSSVDAFPTRVTCDREFVVGAKYMNGDKSQLSDDRFLYVEKGGVEVASGDAYEAGASYTVEMRTASGASVSGQWLWQIKGSTFDCAASTCDCSRAVNANGLAFDGGSGSEVVELYAGWATGFGGVRFTETFILSIPVVTAAPSAAPSAAPVASPTAAPSSAPSTAPVAAPTTAPTMSPVSQPTPTPTPKPTVPQPTPKPTPTPSEAAPDGTCGDSATWYKSAEPEKDCSWVGLQPETRCSAKDENAVFAFEKCLTTCGGCGKACSDSDSWYKAEEPEKDCAWASRLTNRLLVNGADGTIAWRSCSAAAANCEAGLAQTCGDSAGWFKKDDVEKDCDWAADQPETRCLVKNAEAVFAFEVCRSACGGCDAECADSTTWHKKNEAEKDCDWAARFSPRLLVVGEDDTLAFEACRKAARNCDF